MAEAEVLMPAALEVVDGTEVVESSSEVVGVASKLVERLQEVVSGHAFSCDEALL